MFARKASIVAVLLFAGTQAQAGASYTLDALLGGGSFQSMNGKLVFSEFGYQPFFNSPTPSNIAVVALNDGVSFGTPLFSTSGIIDFNIWYKVTAIDGFLIDGVTMQSTGSGTGTGYAGIYKVVEDGSTTGLANLTNAFDKDTTIGTASATFDPEWEIYVRDDVFAVPGQGGTAGLSDFSQRFSTTGSPTPNSIPSPTAALAGAALFGLIGMRRRRRDEVVSNN